MASTTERSLVTEGELTEVVNDLRTKIDNLVQRITRLEVEVTALMDDRKERIEFRRQILMAVFGVGLAQIVALAYALIRFVP